MPTYPFMQVDAFTTQRLGGNPCAIIFNADNLTDAQMLQIAKENNLSETSFVLTPTSTDAKLRYFTPAEEIPLAGHPTIATIFALVETGKLKLTGTVTRISLELTAGIISVEIHAANGVVQKVVMFQKKPQFLAIISTADVMPVFGLTVEDALPNVPLQIVSTGTPQLMIPVRDLDALKRIQIDIPAYTALRDKAKFFCPHVFCTQGVTSTGNTFARDFGVPPDSAEDPFTGSATGGMAAYLWHYGLIPQPTFIAEQGHWMGRPGQAEVEVVGSRDDIETVKVGGPAVTVIRGELML
jgi:trans-2,3-dihydro-3-hydroxyanthranilate isomerase